MKNLGPNFCDQCGKKVIGNEKECTNCGANLTLMPSSKHDLEDDKKISLVTKLKKFLEKELINLISDNSLDKDGKINKIIHLTGAICGVIAMQPIPIADIFILTPIQIVMVLYIGKVSGFEINFDRATEIFTEILGVIGLGLAAQSLVIMGYKTIIPYAGGLFTIPIVWGLTFGIGTAAKKYFELKQNIERKLSKEERSIIKKEYLKEFKEKVKMDKNEIKKYVEEIIAKLKIKF